MKSHFLPGLLFLVTIASLCLTRADAQIVQIRAVADTVSPTTETLTLKEATETKTVHVERAIVFDFDSNIKSVSVAKMFGSPNLIMQFSDKGSELLAALGAKYDRRKLATLVDGRLATFGPVKAPLGGSAINIPCPSFTMDELAAIATRLNSK